LQNQENSRRPEGDPADSEEEALEAALRKSEEKKKSRSHKARNWFDDGEHIVSALTLLLVICTTVVSAALWGVQQDANRINALILASGEKASVFFGMVRLMALPQPEGPMKEAILVEIGNSGGSTTRDLKFRFACRPTGEAPGDGFSRELLARVGYQYMPLAPKQPSIVPQACAYTASELAVTTLAKLSIYVFGEAFYRDTISPATIHHVEFCSRLHNFAVGDRSLAAMSEYCPRHNCADEECDE
jgi:hypothetical protein